MFRGVDEGDRDPPVSVVVRGQQNAVPRKPVVRSTPLIRVGIISNPRSHMNQRRERTLAVEEGVVFKRRPNSLAELHNALRSFAAERVDLLVIDGGDGTVRDVLSAATTIFPDGLPRLAILPSGKTNALAIDLQMKPDTTLADLMRAHRENRVVSRTAIDILRDGQSQPSQRGFLFGSGAFVRATELAQRVHRFGWFNGFAVGLSILWAVLQTIFGTAKNPWRIGERITYVKPDNSLTASDFYMILGSTLQRLPLGIKPFGGIRPGLKFVSAKAPPRLLGVAMPQILWGSTSAWLRKAGYAWFDTSVFRLSFRSNFILDGERFPGGSILIRESEPMEFVVP
ncbi:MAG: diacylglycerol kinase family protein [Sphingobium sp.]